jgi:hypothetical protein
MHFILYFPGRRGVPAGDEHLSSCGLAGLAGEGHSRQAPVWFEPPGRGPDGTTGICCTWLKGDGSDPPMGIVDGWQWQPCRPSPSGPLKKGDYWVGVNPAAGVRPADLERQETLAGYWVTLGDGQQWHVPAAPLMPHVHGLGPDGIYDRQIDQAYRAFHEASQVFAQGIFEKLAQLHVMHATRGTKKLAADFDLPATFAYCVQALSFNYRLNAELITQLGLLNDRGMQQVIKATVDLPVLLTVTDQKKTARVSIPVG